MNFNDFINSTNSEGINEAKFNVGDTYEWHGKEWDPKSQKNVDVVKKVKITKVEGSNIMGQFDGESKEYIIRDASKYLKKKVNESEEVLEGARIQLVDPNTNKFIKTTIFSGPNRDAEKEVEKLNLKLTSQQKDKGFYWTITTYESEEVSESKITVKRKYTENYPAKTVGKHAAIRNKIIEALRDGELTKEEFDQLISGLTEDSKRWLRRNAQFFNVGEEKVSLSSSGQKILKSIDESGYRPMSDDERLKKQYRENQLKRLKAADKKEQELKRLRALQQKLHQDRIKKKNENMENSKFIYESFEEFINRENASFLNEGKTMSYGLTKAQTKKVAETLAKAMSKLEGANVTLNQDSLEEDSFDLDYDGEEGYGGSYYINDKGEVINAAVTPHEIYGKAESSVEDFIKGLKKPIKESLELDEDFIVESLQSSILAGFIDLRFAPKELFKAFYNYTKVALDRIQDADFKKMDPTEAYKNKYMDSSIVFYVSTHEKTNPYAPDGTDSDNNTIPGNALLAIANGQNEFFGVSWTGRGQSGSSLGNIGKDADRKSTVGIGKNYRGWDATGLSNVKRISEVSDVAYVLPLDALRAAYSTERIRATRAASQQGATAMMDAKKIKQENLARYKQIIAQKLISKQDSIDKEVEKVLEETNKFLMDGFAQKNFSKYGELIVGTDPRGRDIKPSDVANYTRSLLDYYSRYINASNALEQATDNYEKKYHERELNRHVLDVRTELKKWNSKHPAIAW